MAKRRRLNPAPFSGAPRSGPAETKHLDVSHAKHPAPPALSGPLPATPSVSAPAPVARVAADASGSAALQEMSDFLTRARAEGRLTIELPVDRVHVDYLDRDRLLPDDPAADEDMRALMESLRARGQQVPIDVMRRHAEPLDTYGLVSGLRRMTALRLLHAETGEDRFARVLARVIAPATLPDAYLAMIEENEIRAGISFYERARIALRSVEAGAFPDLRVALRGLFGNVSRAKRSKIGSFAVVVEALDGHLAAPAALPEKRGLALAQALARGEATPDTLRAALAGRSGAASEQAALEAVLRDVSRAKHREAASGEPSTASVPEDLFASPDPGDPSTPPVRIAAAPGRLTLTGPGVDAAFEADLRAWLAARG